MSRVFADRDTHREQYYMGIKDDPDLNVKLTGSWETVVGSQDTFVHILEYENYHGYDKTTDRIRNSHVGPSEGL